MPIEALDFADRALDFADKTLDFADRALDFADRALDFADRALDFADIKKLHKKWRKHVNGFLFADKMLPICR